MKTTPLVLLGIVVVFLIYRITQRARTLTTRQRVNIGAMLRRIAFLVVLSALVIALGVRQPLSLLGAAIGLLAGAAVAWYGLRLMRFERQADGLYYTPNRYIGLTLLAIFLIRLAYEVIVSIPIYQQIFAHPHAIQSQNMLSLYAADPVTTGVYFLLIGYYIFTYGVLMLRQRRATDDTPALPGATTLGGGAVE